MVWQEIGTSDISFLEVASIYQQIQANQPTNKRNWNALMEILLFETKNIFFNSGTDII